MHVRPYNTHCCGGTLQQVTTVQHTLLPWHILAGYDRTTHTAAVAHSSRLRPYNTHCCRGTLQQVTTVQHTLLPWHIPTGYDRTTHTAAVAHASRLRPYNTHYCHAAGCSRYRSLTFYSTRKVKTRTQLCALKYKPIINST